MWGPVSSSSAAPELGRVPRGSLRMAAPTSSRLLLEEKVRQGLHLPRRAALWTCLSPSTSSGASSSWDRPTWPRALALTVRTREKTGFLPQGPTDG